MSKSKHTPAPWRVIKQMPYGRTLPVFKIFGKTESGHDRHITEIDLISDELLQEEESNASLIAAAPELLSVLEDMLAAHDKEYDLPWGTVRTVIAKAKEVKR